MLPSSSALSSPDVLPSLERFTERQMFPFPKFPLPRLLLLWPLRPSLRQPWLIAFAQRDSAQSDRQPRPSQDVTPVTPASCPSEHAPSSSPFLPHSLRTHATPCSPETGAFIKAFITQFARLCINTRQGGLLSLNTLHTHTHTHIGPLALLKRPTLGPTPGSDTTLQSTLTFCFRRQRCYIRSLSGGDEAEQSDPVLLHGQWLSRQCSSRRCALHKPTYLTVCW